MRQADVMDKFNTCDPQWTYGVLGNIGVIRVVAPELFPAMLPAPSYP